MMQVLCYREMLNYSVLIQNHFDKDIRRCLSLYTLMGIQYLQQYLIYIINAIKMYIGNSGSQLTLDLFHCKCFLQFKNHCRSQFFSFLLTGSFKTFSFICYCSCVHCICTRWASCWHVPSDHKPCPDTSSLPWAMSFILKWNVDSR